MSEGAMTVDRFSDFLRTMQSPLSCGWMIRTDRAVSFGVTNLPMDDTVQGLLRQGQSHPYHSGDVIENPDYQVLEVERHFANLGDRDSAQTLQVIWDTIQSKASEREEEHWKGCPCRTERGKCDCYMKPSFDETFDLWDHLSVRVERQGNSRTFSRCNLMFYSKPTIYTVFERAARASDGNFIVRYVTVKGDDKLCFGVSRPEEQGQNARELEIWNDGGPHSKEGRLVARLSDILSQEPENERAFCNAIIKSLSSLSPRFRGRRPKSLKEDFGHWTYKFSRGHHDYCPSVITISHEYASDAGHANAPMTYQGPGVSGHADAGSYGHANIAPQTTPGYIGYPDAYETYRGE